MTTPDFTAIAIDDVVNNIQAKMDEAGWKEAERIAFQVIEEKEIHETAAYLRNSLWYHTRTQGADGDKFDLDVSEFRDHSLVIAWLFDATVVFQYSGNVVDPNDPNHWG